MVRKPVGSTAALQLTLQRSRGPLRTAKSENHRAPAQYYSDFLAAPELGRAGKGDEGTLTGLTDEFPYGLACIISL